MKIVSPHPPPPWTDDGAQTPNLDSPLPHVYICRFVNKSARELTTTPSSVCIIYFCVVVPLQGLLTMKTLLCPWSASKVMELSEVLAYCDFDRVPR